MQSKEAAGGCVTHPGGKYRVTLRKHRDAAKPANREAPSGEGYR